MQKVDWRFTTQRLEVNEWHRVSMADRNRPQALASIVASILTAPVTASLPPGWQGDYTRTRAKKWIEERDNEGMTLLVVEKVSGKAIGLILLFEQATAHEGSELRLGYLLSEQSWGKGFATELINGFVQQCKSCRVKSVTAGVAIENVASQRVLEKCGFERETTQVHVEENVYILNITP